MPKEVFYLIKKVEICGVNTSKLPVLSNEEKNELFVRIKQGDETAREEFINRESKISFKCDTKIWRTWRKFRRFIPSWMYWLNKSNR